jgi:DNA (cytosine-5)-methyltransferase 1
VKPAYYNEIDPYAAQWLRNLIAAGHIAAGDVDERSIEDVRPDDLRGYTQCHFFAGIGVWSYALRLAGWPDDRPVWTGSCPCQPFSAAGKGAGFADERHLWPAFFHLISERRPAKVFGEQVASKDADPWIDLVQTDLEALDYAVGAVPFPAAGVGSPNIRDRLYWVADASSTRQLSRAQRGIYRGKESAGARHGESERHGSARRLDHSDHARLEGFGSGYKAEVEWWRAFRSATEAGESLRLADDSCDGRREQCADVLRSDERGGTQELEQRLGSGGVFGNGGSASPTNGIWADADWLFCRDGKWRPVEPGTFPLAHGVASRVGRLRAYGNAINAQQAAEFIRAVM